MIQDFHTGSSGAGGISGGSSGKKPGQRCIRDSVHVFFRGKRSPDQSIIKSRWERTKNQASVNGLILIDLADQTEQILLSAVFRKDLGTAGDADAAAAFLDAGLIPYITEPVSNPDQGQDRFHTFFFQQGSLVLQRGQQGCAYGFTNQ